MAESSDSESSLFSSIGCLSSHRAAQRNLMSPTVVITAGIMIKDAKGDRKLTGLYLL